MVYSLAVVVPVVEQHTTAGVRLEFNTVNASQKVSLKGGDNGDRDWKRNFEWNSSLPKESKIKRRQYRNAIISNGIAFSDEMLKKLERVLTAFPISFSYLNSFAQSGGLGAARTTGSMIATQRHKKNTKNRISEEEFGSF